MSVHLAKLKDLVPYAVAALVVPGGSLIAPLLWLYRRRKNLREPMKRHFVVIKRSTVQGAMNWRCE